MACSLRTAARGQIFVSAKFVQYWIMNELPRIEIKYCTQCRWLMRAAWMAQELLSTFEAELGGVTLVPGSGGVFEIRVDGSLIWSRAEQQRFPEIKELKQLVRDRVAPGKSLGHTDTPREKTEP
jgi:selenoprotein W-related protein